MRPDGAVGGGDEDAVGRLGGETGLAPGVGSGEIVGGAVGVDLAAVDQLGFRAETFQKAGEEGSGEIGGIAGTGLTSDHRERSLRFREVGTVVDEEDDVRKLGNDRLHDLGAAEAGLGTVLR